MFSYIQSQKGSASYDENLENLQYDLLYGKRYAYNGTDKYPASDLIMGIDDVTSPTFTIIKEYVGELPLYHMDVYRLEDSHEDIGIEEYFDKGGVTIIEWADMIKDILPEERLDIKIKIADDNTRILILKPHGEKYVNICEAII